MLPNKSASQIRQALDRSQVSLPELIKTAELKTSGKACCATLVEWKCVRDGVNGQSGAQDSAIGSMSNRNSNSNDNENDASRRGYSSHDLADEDPVALVTCVSNNNQATEVVVCAKTGKVIATKQCSSFRPGKSAFLGDAASGEWNRRLGWNRAPRRWQRLSDLMAKPLRSTRTNEEIGSIEEIVIDPDGGRAMYVVVEYNSGSDDKLHAIPFGAATLSQDYKSVDVQFDNSNVETTRGFENSNWPNMTDESWARGVYEAYGERPYWMRGDDRSGSHSSGDMSRNGNSNPPRSMTDQPKGIDEGTSRNDQVAGAGHRNGMKAPRRWQKASDLIGKTVRNPQTNEDLGDLKDIVVDPDSGRVLYGALSFGGFLGLGDKLFAVPWGSLELAQDYKSLSLTIDKQRLKNAEGFDENKWPDMANRQWATRTYNFYDQPRYWESTESVAGGSQDGE